MESPNTKNENGKRILAKSIIFEIIYIIILTVFSVYVLLDTFVIEKGEIVVLDNTQNSNTTVSRTSASSSLNNVGSNNLTEVNESNEVISTSTSDYYSDENITIKINTITEYDTQVYVADIQVNSIDYLKTAFANNTYGRNIKQTTSAMATAHNAILAINGDYYGFRNYGYVLRNGVIYRTTAKSSSEDEDLVINADGSFSIINESTTNLNELLNKGALQVLSFGPALINNGTLSVDEASEVSQSKSSNPRTAIGIIGNLHYVFVVSDGRTNESAGLSLYELATIMKDLGCTTAYNLDGGGSSSMYFNGQIINNPTDGMTTGERSVSDIVYIGY